MSTLGSVVDNEQILLLTSAQVVTLRRFPLISTLARIDEQASLHILATIELANLLRASRIDPLIRDLATHLNLLQHVIRFLLKHDSLHVCASTLGLVLQS